MARTIYDGGLLRWEAFVSGGQPHTPAAARILFLCLDAPLARACYVTREDGDVAAAERALVEMTDEELRKMLAESVELG